MRRIFIIFLCTCLLLSLFGCGIGKPVETLPVITRDPEPKEEGILDIYYLRDPITTAQSIVQAFKSQNPNMSINVTAFNTAEEMDQQLTSVLPSGEGPDVILFTDANQLDTVKLARNDAFLDLSGILGEDMTFDTENYYPVLEAGVVGGGQYLMPLRMRLMYMMTTQERFENALALEDTYTLKQLMQALMEHNALCPEDTSAMHTMHSFDSFLYDLLRITGVQMVDLEALTRTVSEDTLMEYGAFAKTAYAACLQAAKDMREYGSNNFGEMLRRNTAILSKESLPITLRYFSTLYSKGLEESIALITYPDQNDPEALIADISLYAAVVKTTDNLPGAYSFVRSAMDSSLGNLNQQLPVSKQGVTELLRALAAGTGKTVVFDSQTFAIDKLSPEDEEMCVNILNRIQRGSIPNAAIRSLVAAEMQSFVKGEEGFDSCWQRLEGELDVYLEEMYK